MQFETFLSSTNPLLYTLPIMGFGAMLPFLSRSTMSMSLTLKSAFSHSDNFMLIQLSKTSARC